MSAPRVALKPDVEVLRAAIEAGGGIVAEPAEADAIVWTNPADPQGLKTLLSSSPARWIQLPFAGIESFFDAGVIDPARTWTCAKVVYGTATAELAVTLILAAARAIHRHVEERTWWPGEWTTHRRLEGTTALVVGTGGIGSALARMLPPLGIRVVAVNRSGRPLQGADRTEPVSQLSELVSEADWLVLATALTSETKGLIDEGILARMKRDAWVINVARGGVVDTDALVAALRAESIGGAGLDVTDPEPLPDDHPLWTLPNVIITSHTANTVAMALPELAGLIERNVRKFSSGEPLEGLVDPAAGY